MNVMLVRPCDPTRICSTGTYPANKGHYQKGKRLPKSVRNEHDGGRYRCRANCVLSQPDCACQFTTDEISVVVGKKSLMIVDGSRWLRAGFAPSPPHRHTTRFPPPFPSRSLLGE